MVSSKQLTLFTGIVIFWIGAIFTVLYIPAVFQKFSSNRSINVFMWSGVIDTKIIAQFEKETGIKVHASYFEGNDELIVKVLATKGRGYDMLVPSDYAVSFFIKTGLLKKIDKTKLDFWAQLNPRFLNHSFDRENEYSIPAEWYVLGLGVNKDHFEGALPEASWKTIFDAKLYDQYYMGIINDIRELSNIAIKYSYGKVRPITDEETEHIKQLLITQKQKVEAYTDFRGDFLLESGNCSVVLVPISAIWKTLLKNPSVEFLLPQEGTLMGIENYVILENSTKQDLVYQFINYLFRLDVQRHNFEQKIFLSTRIDADFISENPILKQCLDAVNNPDGPGGAQPFENVLTDEQVNELCMAIKGQ